MGRPGRLKGTRGDWACSGPCSRLWAHSTAAGRACSLQAPSGLLRWAFPLTRRKPRPAQWDFHWQRFPAFPVGFAVQANPGGGDAFKAWNAGREWRGCTTETFPRLSCWRLAIKGFTRSVKPAATYPYRKDCVALHAAQLNVSITRFMVSKGMPPPMNTKV